MMPGAPAGEEEALKYGTSAGGGVFHNSEPLAGSNAATIPLMPSVKSRPSWNSGVAFGPEACADVGSDGVYGASYPARQNRSPLAAFSAVITSCPSTRVKV